MQYVALRRAYLLVITAIGHTGLPNIQRDPSAAWPSDIDMLAIIQRNM